MEKRILNQWLKAGYFEKKALFPTTDGTPRGSIISPTLANMVLDGIENVIDKALHIHRATDKGRYKNPQQIHLVRYADDFIITSNDKLILVWKSKLNHLSKTSF